MAYGIEVYDASGRVLLSSADKIGRFTGYFTIPSHNGSGTKTSTFQIPQSVLNNGRPFIWWKQVPSSLSAFDSESDMYNLNMSYTISESGLVTVTSKVSQPALRIYYGIY